MGKTHFENINNFYQVIKQTDEEKMAMYMKLLKKEIISMLIEANKFIDKVTPTIVEAETIKCDYYITSGTCGSCNNCGRQAHEH